MPSAIKHDHEMSAKGLVTILVESQGSDQENLEAFLWKTFPDSSCFTCVGTFVPLPESSGLPHGGLIGVDGTLLWSGNPVAVSSRVIEDLLDQELTKVKKGWGDTAEARKVRAALYGKGDFATALTTIVGMAEGDERKMLQEEVDRRYQSLKNAIGVLKEEGRWLDAQKSAKDLLKGVANTQWAAEITTMVAEFDADAGKAEIALDRKLEKIMKQLRDKKGDAAQKGLLALLKGASGKVGERMTWLKKILDVKI